MRLFSPAKVNLHLAVTGKRADGFHDLVSLVCPLSFGDFLTVSLSDQAGELAVSCTDPEVPTDESNLVVRASRVFLDGLASRQGLTLHLEKRIPMEAGLGGGSSNAATALLILNRLFGEPFSLDALSEMAAGLGSDCPLFLHRKPVLLRGRGESIETLPETAVATLESREIVLFKPWVGISTAWAYGNLAAIAGTYANREDAESRLSDWKLGKLPLQQLLFNSFEGPVFKKFPMFPALFGQIEEELGLKCLLSGSGSACFVLLNETDPAGTRLHRIIQDALGDDFFFATCRLGAKNC